MSQFHQSNPGFDIEANIVKAGNVASPVDLSIWQARIDKITGKTVENRSRLRIVWGQQRTMFVMGRQRMTYPFYRIEGEDGEIHDIGTPRFYVEELHDVSELRANNGWETARYQWNGLEKLDVLGPMPEEGFYSSVFMIAHHDELCCSGEGQVRGNLCLGSYRPPSDADLTRIRRMKQRRDNAPNFQNAPSEEQIRKWAKEAAEKRDERFSEKIHDAVKSWIAQHGHRITDSMNPKIVKHGKYKTMPSVTFEGNSIKENSNDSSSSQRAA